MAGCYCKDSICITFDCPLRHYQACKTMQKIEYFKCYLVSFCLCQKKNSKCAPSSHVLKRMLNMSHAKQKLLANNNNMLLKQRHMQTYITRAFTQMQALHLTNYLTKHETIKQFCVCALSQIAKLCKLLFLLSVACFLSDYISRKLFCVC